MYTTISNFCWVFCACLCFSFCKKHDKGDADLFLLINHNNIASANRNQLRSVNILLFQVQSLPKVPLMQTTVEQCFNSSNLNPSHLTYVWHNLSPDQEAESVSNYQYSACLTQLLESRIQRNNYVDLLNFVRMRKKRHVK